MTSTLTPGRLLGEGKYELLSPLGQGAMGSVWLARHVALDRMVAVKLLHSGLQLGRSLASTQARRDNASERFLKEARTASLLRHKNTVQLLDYGADTVDRWLVMEYLEGKNLSDVLYEAGRFPAPRAIAIVTQVLAALAEAHEFGIVHRDLKPANIMLVPWVDDDGRETELAKVLDFGIATMMSDEVGDRNEVAGTPEYMSPEQAQAFDVDPRSDLYAVGILLFHLLTGETPFRGETPMDTMLAQVNAVPVPPRKLERSISADLEAVVLSALAKDPDDRPESARAMRAALLALPEAKGLKSDSAQRLPPVASPPTTTAPAASPLPGLGQGQVIREESPARRGAMMWIAVAGLALGAAALVVGLTRTETVEVAAPVPAVILAQAPAPTLEEAPEAPPAPKLEASPALTAESAAAAEPEVAPPQTAPSEAPSAEAGPPEAPSAEAAPAEAPKAEATPSEALKAEAAPKPQDPPTMADVAPRSEETKAVADRVEPKVAKVDTTHTSPAATRELTKVLPAKVEPAKVEPAAANVEPAAAKVEPAKAEPVAAKVEPAKVEPAKVEPTKVQPAKVEPPPSLAASAGITALSTRGSLPRSVVARALESTRGSLETCYATAARAAGRDQAGATNATIVYDPDGKVSSVNVAPLPLPGLSECVNQSLWRTRLRERPDTGSVDATFRIVFSPR